MLSVTEETYFDNHVVLHDTKNGDKRIVPVTETGSELFTKVLASDIKINSSSLDALWRKYKNIIDLHFHDTRHEGHITTTYPFPI